MAKKKRRRGGRGFRIGKYVGLAGKALGGFIVATPAITAWKASGNDLSRFGLNARYQYIGIDEAGNWDQAKAMQGIGTVVAGILVAKLFSVAARRL